ncbi:hypothetical protein EIP86_002793 [Pleurotus ostreatoroseus]|nr:hypothetical protein EIP86_002793 [Pleurotus ostreatoroseus]
MEGDESPPLSARSPMSRVPSYIQFAPRSAIASFENLVALANYEERLKEARRIVWRDKGETPVELESLWGCVEHAGKGATRAGSIAFAIRSGVNLILLLSRIKRIPNLYMHILHERLRLLLSLGLLDTDIHGYTQILPLGARASRTLRAGLLEICCYAWFILNSLPLILPRPALPPPDRAHSRSRSKFRQQHKHKLQLSAIQDDDALAEDDADVEAARGRLLQERKARLSISAQAHQVWVRKKTRRWYSVVAGALAGGLAILCEKEGRRTGIAQQMFVRGLQGSYNAFSDKHGIRIPHGEAIVFSLCCGQILYAFLLRPDTLDRSYVNWIQEAGKIPRESVSMNRDLVREHRFKMSDLDGMLARKDLTPLNRSVLEARKARASLPIPQYGPYYVPCETCHPPLESCMVASFDRFYRVFRWMLPIYGALHLIPTLLFKRKTVMKDPLKMLLRTLMGTARSSAFLGMFVVIYQTFFCFKHNMWAYLTALRSPEARSLLAIIVKQLPQPMVDFLISKPSFWLGGLLTGLSLFVEEKRRRAELAMYVLPKGLESAWVMARGKGLVFGTGRYGNVLVCDVLLG